MRMDFTTKQLELGNRRLERLAALLERLPRQRFNYNKWVGDDWKGMADLSCGTTACALGWATTLPFARREGLKLNKNGDGPEAIHNVLSGETGGDAGNRIFALDTSEARFLFLPGGGCGVADCSVCAGVTTQQWIASGYPTEIAERMGRSPRSKATPKAVAKHIRRFVKLRREAMEKEAAA